MLTDKGFTQGQAEFGAKKHGLDLVCLDTRSPAANRSRDCALTYRATKRRSPVQKNIHVVGAVVLVSGKVLCVQRGPNGSLPGLWEFPGGKIEPGETPQQALHREVLEELQCQVNVGDKVTTTRHEYDFGIVHLTTFYCELIDGSPRLSEHSDMAWRDPADLRDLVWAPADIPAIHLIEERFGARNRFAT